MQNVVDNYPPVQYEIVWLLVGLGLSLIIIVWYGFIFWFTRRKKQRNVTSLSPITPRLPDIAALQAKYLALILEIEQANKRGEITTRSVHQKLSILLRFFAYESKGIRAHVLTLSDLKKTRLTNLAVAIEGYYAPEFDEVQHGDVNQAFAKARDVVTTWS